MIHTRAKGQGQRSLGSKVRVETNGRMDGGDCITSPANMVGNNIIISVYKLFTMDGVLMLTHN